ncbi:hypothetical protein Hanom_Chr05g00419441 [Helianthus anomalus]
MILTVISKLEKCQYLKHDLTVSHINQGIQNSANNSGSAILEDPTAIDCLE